MRFVLVVCLAAVLGDGVYGSVTSTKRRIEEVHHTRPDPALPVIHANPNLGALVDIDETAPDSGEPHETSDHPHVGSEVAVPDDDFSDSVEEKDASTRSAKARSLPSSLVPTETAPPATKTKELLVPKPPAPPPVKTDHSCPSTVSAFCTVRNLSYLFSDEYVYTIRNDTIQDASPISLKFPDGPDSVNAAVYDKEKRLVVLIENRTVYAYHPLGKIRVETGKFKLDSTYPKELPDNIPFTPIGAMRWHDKRQVLLSNDGRFALYDEYWNKSLMTARTEDYFEDLPKDVRGVSKWENDEGKIYTHDLVYVYKVLDNSISGDGIPVSTFFHC